MEEIDLMKQIGCHVNVLRMIGFWTRSEPFLLLLEYVPNGDLLTWLREKRYQVRRTKEINHHYPTVLTSKYDPFMFVLNCLFI